MYMRPMRGESRLRRVLGRRVVAQCNRELKKFFETTFSRDPRSAQVDPEIWKQRFNRVSVFPREKNKDRERELLRDMVPMIGSLKDIVSDIFRGLGSVRSAECAGPIALRAYLPTQGFGAGKKGSSCSDHRRA